MKKNNIIGCLLIALLHSFSWVHAQQSYDLAVLQMQSKGKYTRIFNPQTNVSTLLSKKGNRQATIEFWALHNTLSSGLRDGAKWEVSNLLTNNKQFSVAITKDKIVLKIGNTTREKSLLLQDKLFMNQWTHYAITFNKNANEVRVFINGNENLFNKTLNFDLQELYFLSNQKTDLYLSEYRAWSVQKTKAKILAEQYKTFYKQPKNVLEELKNNGLEIVYTNTKTATKDYLGGNVLMTNLWTNLLYQHFPTPDYNKNGTFTMNIKGTNVASVRSDIPNPIENLNKIIVVASDGNGASHPLLAGTNGILVQWGHAKNIDSYTIKRRNVRAGTTSSVIHTVRNVSNKRVSSDLSYIDKGVLPNELYEYTIEGLKKGVTSITGKDVGLVLANGSVTGTIETSSRVATKNVKVEAVANNNQNPGGALKIVQNAKPIQIKNIEALRNSQGGKTFEFWYKTPTIVNGENTILELGHLKVVVTKDKLALKVGSRTHVEGTRISDTNWHHYAFTSGPSGIVLYQDGVPMQNASVATQFNPDYSTVSAVNLASNTTGVYHLDEVRFWNVARTPLQIREYAKHVIGGNVTGLFVYYRFDFNDPKKVYNFSTTQRGQYIGESTGTLQHLPANEQPNITYATYTNATGNYEFTTLNTGIQGVTNTDNTFLFTIKPSKPRFAFLPKTRPVKVPRKLNGALVNSINFTDVSSLPITGVISYRVGNQLYPVIKGTALKVDGSVIQSKDDAKVKTDIKGTYAIKAAPGRHTITPNAVPALENETPLNEASLKFDGKTAYATSSASINSKGQSFLWSGYIRPHVAKGAKDKIPVTQTVLQWGSLSLKLVNNNTLKVYTGTQEKVSQALPANSAGQFTFFAVRFDKKNGTLTLFINDTKQSTALASLTIFSQVLVGSENNKSTYSNYLKSNIDVLEYRTTALGDSDVKKVREGGYIAPETSQLQLSYLFNQRAGTKAINNVVKNNSTDNNYLQFAGGCSFDGTLHQRYVRAIQYQYKATNKKFNPQGNSYVVAVEKPLQNLNFENVTRRSFIGNIVVPCNNSVGAWSGRIVRTDIKLPKFEKTISAANFDASNTVFTVNDLLPGMYRVELTNVTSKRKLQSPIIDLRRDNVAYDFEYRNPMEVEIALYKFDKAGFADKNNIYSYTGAQVNATCNSKYVFNSHESFRMKVNVFERYGVNKCPVDGAQVSLNGDAILSDRRIVGQALSGGEVNYFTTLSTPNFLGDYTRSFLISASHKGRNTSVTKRVIILGARQGNADFTIVDPQVGFVLHDPPGDGSSATLAKGATYTQSLSKENGGGMDMDNSIGAKVRVNINQLAGAVAAPLGVGTVIGVIHPTGSSTTDALGLIGGNFSTTRHSGNTETVTLETSISTPTSDTYIGEDADVFIGKAKIITFGTGKVLKLKKCTPVVENSSKVARPTTFTPFIYTKQSIQDVVIPNLYNLAIAKYDKNNSITNPTGRNSLDPKGTLEKLLTATPNDRNDRDIKNYLHQIARWNQIIANNHKKRTRKYFDSAPTFSKTTKKLTNGNDIGTSAPGLNATTLDKRISFDALTSVTYTLSRAKSSSSGLTFSGGGYVGFSASKDFTVFGIGLSLSNQTKIHTSNSSTNASENGNNRVDSFTFNDNDAGDHFDVSIRRDPEYDTPMFLTNAGRSSCPFESGTVPREGVELVVDKAVGYGTGNESILYNLTLRNTQIARDNTRKTYKIKLSSTSNPKGAVVQLNGSKALQSAAGQNFSFGLDPKSSTGVSKEIKAQLRISRGKNAASVISYENIKIQMYSECEHSGDGYRSYRVDEYKEVGVKPLSEVLVTAHFTGACIETITADAPKNDWIVNSSDKKRLDFKFRIPGLKSMPANKDFSVDLEYTIKGNNTPRILKKLDLKTLKKYLNAKTDRVEYSADVSGLTNGEYNFRIVPVCGTGGASNPNNRKNPTAFVRGRIARNAPRLVSTNPSNGGVFKTGTISAKFSSAINPASVNLNSLAIRGKLGGLPKPLTSVKLDNINDVITIPHNNKFNSENKFTIEMWVNPAKYPTSGKVPILQKGTNYNVSLTSNGRIDIGEGVVSTSGIQPFTWTHVAIVSDKVNGTATIYFNGSPVGSGRISSGLNSNEKPILIAPLVSGDSFVGSLDEIRLWQSTRSPLQITSNMKNQLLGNETGLEAYFVFNNNTLAKQGINGKPNEAVQDFTGNATGTTATGIEFVRNEEAAPLDKTKTVDDIQFTTTMSENNTVINFNMKITDLGFVEGAQLTVFVKDKKLQDPSGNKIDKTSWSFIIDRNALKWSRNNIAITQKQGEATLIKDLSLINKDGGIDVAYTFKNLPVWFSVNSGANASETATNTIRARETNSKLVFEVKSFLNPGVHTADIYITTSNKATGVKLGVESFRVEVTVACAEPTVSKSFKNDYPFNMNMKGNLIINGQKSLDTKDVVKVYAGNKIRGYAKVGSNGIVDLAAFGNTGENSPLTFKVWDASECTEYEGIVENYSLMVNTTVGTNPKPVKFTVGKKVTRRIPVVKGFQEISFNLKDSKASNFLALTAIKGLPAKSEILDISSTNLKATLGTNGKFTGTLTRIDVSKAYLVKVSTNTVKYIEISGTPVELNTNISVAGSKARNAIPFYPNDLQRTGYALRSFTSTKVSVGDRIERRGLFAEYSATEGWRGSLTHLTPGLGYIFIPKKAGAINYSGIVKSGRSRLASRGATVVYNENNFSELEETPSYKDLDLTVDVNKYANFMYINGVVNNEDLDFKANTILAFVGKELRGVSKVEFINGKYHYYIGIGSNGSEEVQFKLYNGTDVVALENTEKFSANKVMGSMKKPYSFKLKDASLGGNQALSLSQNIPNPMLERTQISYSIPHDAIVDLSLYNTIGQKVHTFVRGNVKGKRIHTILWDGVANGSKLRAGVYIYELRVGKQRLQRKLIIR